MTGDMPIIMLSGMGADARVFRKQMEAIPRLQVPEWIEPLPNESLAMYAKRFAAAINPGKRCVVGGASFGGFVALEMIQHLEVSACFLIGSARSPAEFPRRFSHLRKAAQVSKILPFEAAVLLSKAALLSGGSFSESLPVELLKQLSDSDASFLRWACRAVLGWEGRYALGGTPVYQIHGEKDFVLPAKTSCADVLVAGAGHAVSMSHPDAVTQFLIDRSEQV